MKWLHQRVILWMVCACGVMAGGCKSPTPDADAFGTVTVSTPLFTPLTDAIGDGKRLAFGDLRDEQKIAEAIQKANVGISNLEYESLKTAVAATFAGPQLSSTDTTTKKIDAATAVEERTKERKRTFESPEVPSAPPTDTPGDAQEKLLALLERSANQYQLPPGDVAALVAAYKTYMVNLEEYYNVEGYQNIFGGAETKWLPYKVFFTVSAQPGWYTQGHDAVAQLTFGDPSKFRVLTVMPPETAQTLDELGALLRSVATSGEVGGGFQAVAVKAKLDHIKAVARRLEGLKTNTTVIAGYPAANKALVRFRPAFTPDAKRPYDLQPTSHVMTALVLVSTDAAEPVTEADKSARRSGSGTKEIKSTLLISRESRIAPPVRTTKQPPVDAAPGTAPMKEPVVPNRMQPRGGAGTEPRTKTLPGTIAVPTEPQPLVPKPGTCRVAITSRFTVSQKPKSRFIFSKDPPMPQAGCSSPVDVDVPMWPEVGATPFGIGKAFGYYWGDASNSKVAHATVGYQISNPTDLPVALWVSGSADEGGESELTFIGTGPQEGSIIVQVPKPATDGAQVRVFLHAALAHETEAQYVFSENKVLEVVLEPQAKGPGRGAASPALSITSGEIQLQPPVPVGNLTPDVLKALVGERKDVQILIGTPPSPKDGSKASNPTTRP